MRYKKDVAKVFFAVVLALLFFPTYSTATPLNIVDLPQGTSGSFSHNFFHAATGCGGACGAIQARILLDTTQSSTYDPITGDLSLHVILTNKDNTSIILGSATGTSSDLLGSNFTGDTTPNFAIAGSITWDFDTTAEGNSFSDTTMQFFDKNYGLSSSSPKPNEWANGQLTLWGANGTPDISNGKFTNATRGVDIVIQVPIPSSLLFFAPGFLAFVAWRWKQETNGLI